MTFRLRASWVHSLKEKRMIVKSLIAKLQNRYHVSAAEIDEQDVHQMIVIGVAAIVPHNAMADSLMDDISLFDSDAKKGGTSNAKNKYIRHAVFQGLRSPC